MKIAYFVISAALISQTSSSFAQVFPGEPANTGQTSSSVSTSQAAPVKLSPSTLSSLKSMPGYPYGKTPVDNNFVTLENGLKLILDETPAAETLTSRTQTSRTLITRRQKIQTVPGIYSYYFHLVENSPETPESKAQLIAEVYLRVDVRNDGSDNGEVFFLSEKPPTSVESIFKIVETKIKDTPLSKIELKK